VGAVENKGRVDGEKEFAMRDLDVRFKPTTEAGGLTMHAGEGARKGF